MDYSERLDGLAEQQQTILTQLDRLDRSPSKARAVSRGYTENVPAASDGRWITAIADTRSHDLERQTAGKAVLEELGSRYEEPGAKATLGDTGAAGGFVMLPNPVVDVQKQLNFTNPYRRILTVRTGVMAPGVDIPTRNVATARAVIAAFGTTKENTNVTIAKYSATMYTLARIYDVGNQLLRHSAGVAEADVRSELTNAIALGERYYTMAGSGTSEPYGLLTALGAVSGFTSTFASASTTTVAGSLASAIAVCLGALMGRNRINGLTAVVGPTTYATAIAEGADTAGFWFNPSGGAGQLPGWPPGTLSIFGIPIIVDAQLASKQLIVGDFTSTTMYVGQDFRVDVSDTAGTRWDTNETGFRGEEEFGINFLPSVYAGAYQLITNAVP